MSSSNSATSDPTIKAVSSTNKANINATLLCRLAEADPTASISKEDLASEESINPTLLCMLAHADPNATVSGTELGLHATLHGIDTIINELKAEAKQLDAREEAIVLRETRMREHEAMVVKVLAALKASEIVTKALKEAEEAAKGEDFAKSKTKEMGQLFFCNGKTAVPVIYDNDAGTYKHMTRYSEAETSLMREKTGDPTWCMDRSMNID